jgi:HSP20 family protein
MFYGNCCTPRNAWREVFGQDTDEHDMPLDVLEGKDDYVIRASLPGFKKEDVEVKFEDGILYLRATRNEAAPEGAEYVHQERAQGVFTRKARLSRATGENVKAELKDGVLTVTLARAKETAGRSVPIE